eukprot:2637343-Lingulodinium_polyedra.AAC.1
MQIILTSNLFTTPPVTGNHMRQRCRKVHSPVYHCPSWPSSPCSKDAPVFRALGLHLPRRFA